MTVTSFCPTRAHPPSPSESVTPLGHTYERLLQTHQPRQLAALISNATMLITTQRKDTALEYQLPPVLNKCTYGLQIIIASITCLHSIRPAEHVYGVLYNLRKEKKGLGAGRPTLLAGEARRGEAVPWSNWPQSSWVS